MSSQVTEESIKAGQAVYTPNTLKAYDLVVHGISNHLIWRCPTETLRRFYSANVSSNHLEVAVGSGYFPDKCAFPSDKPRIALMDINQSTLDFAAQRIQRYQPETYIQDIFQPVTQKIPHFDSMSLNYLLHCIPGSMAEKCHALDHLLPLLNPNATVFGATLLQGGVKRNIAAKGLMGLYNRKGIFHNQDDSLAELKLELAKRFNNASIKVVGSAALFAATI